MGGRARVGAGAGSGRVMTQLGESTARSAEVGRGRPAGGAPRTGAAAERESVGLVPAAAAERGAVAAAGHLAGSAVVPAQSPPGDAAPAVPRATGACVTVRAAVSECTRLVQRSRATIAVRRSELRHRSAMQVGGDGMAGSEVTPAERPHARRDTRDRCVRPDVGQPAELHVMPDPRPACHWRVESVGHKSQSHQDGLQ